MKKQIFLLFASLLVCLPLAAQDYDTLIQQSLTLRNQGNMTAAEALLREAWPIPDDKREVAMLLGMVLAFQDRFLEGQRILEDALNTYPEDIPLQLALARVLSYQGIYTRALDQAEAVMELQPENNEAINLAGRIALYQSRPGLALELFNSVLAREPENLEGLVGRYDAELALNEPELAQATLQQAAVLAPEHTDVVTRQNPAQATLARANEVSTGFSRSDFSITGFTEWNDRFFEYRHLHATGNQEYIRINHNHHFALHDTLTEVGLLLRQNTSLPLELAIAYTDDADFSADYLARIATRVLLNPGRDYWGALIVSPLYQYSSYINGETHRLQLGFEYYLRDSNAWLTPTLGMVRDQDGKDTFAWGLGLHWQASSKNRIGGSYSDAPETENLLTTDTTSYWLYWRHQLNDSLSFSLNYSRMERDEAYNRDELGLVLQYRY